jgi:Holliday junction resolvasome RuvABC ATP-dependent DNA helicase subunit
MFVGQTKIMEELNIIYNRMKGGDDFNILFRAPSGYGKTDLGLRIIAGFPNEYLYYIPDDAGKINLVLSYRIHFIDEVHTLKQPELLYPHMDSKLFTFLLASNESGELKEPLVNRCIQFIFEEYTKEELSLYVNNIFNNFGIKLSSKQIEIITENGIGNPRIIKQICQRLINIFRIYGIPKDENELVNYIINILRIDNGLTEYHIRYLNYLKEVKRSSLVNISNCTHIDKATIVRDIEPVLLYKKLIKITPKGREIGDADLLH